MPNLELSVLFGGETNFSRYDHGFTNGTGDTVGGFYSYKDMTHQARAMIVHPTSSFFTPGNILLRIKNVGDETITSARLNFHRYHRNDQERPLDFKVSYVIGDYEVSEDQYTELHPDKKDPDPPTADGYVPVCESEPMAGINWPANTYLYLRFTINDVADHPATGARDEAGIASVYLTTNFDDNYCIDAPSSALMPTTTPDASRQNSGGLSGAAIAGIAVGVTLTVIVVGAAVGAPLGMTVLYLLKRFKGEKLLSN